MAHTVTSSVPQAHVVYWYGIPHWTIGTLARFTSTKQFTTRSPVATHWELMGGILTRFLKNYEKTNNCLNLHMLTVEKASQTRDPRIYTMLYRVSASTLDTTPPKTIAQADLLDNSDSSANHHAMRLIERS